MMACLREKGLRVHYYLDEILLLLADSQQSLLHHWKILIYTLQQFWWIINWKKSKLKLAQKMTFLGAELNTNFNTVENLLGENSSVSSKDKVTDGSSFYTHQGMPEHFGKNVIDFPSGPNGI